MVAMKEKFGAWLMVDEAHATGLYGKSRRGLAEEFGVAERIEIQMGTLGKALGVAGGYICGSRIVDRLSSSIAPARFIFSTAPVPAAAAAADRRECVLFTAPPARTGATSFGPTSSGLQFRTNQPRKRQRNAAKQRHHSRS